MTKEQVEAIARQIVRENEHRYHKMKDLPGWAKGPVEEVYQRLNLGGTGQREDEITIDASPTYVRTLVVLRQMLRKLEQGASAQELEMAQTLDLAQTPEPEGEKEEVES